MRHRLMFAASLLMACEAQAVGGAEGSGGDGASPGATSSGTPGSSQAGGAGACSDLVLLAPATELAKTPRADLTAEHLAREASGAFVAPDDLYELVTADLAAIRALEPAVASIEARPLGVSGVQINWTEPVLDPDAYHAWDCLNAAYGMKVSGIDDHGAYISLRPDEPRSYDTVALALAYAALPNVRETIGLGVSIDGPDVCLERRGDVRHYVFDDAGGDCPGGCTTHVWYGFRVGPGASPEVVGVATAEEDGDGIAEPDWLVDLAACREQLRF